METNDRNVARWVDQRLDALQAPADFQPTVAQALARVEERRRAHKVTVRRWFWALAAAAAVCLAALAMPAPCSAASASSCGQPVATRLWDSVFRKPVAPPVNYWGSVKESGSATAPITCEIYSDYECPACARIFRDTLPLVETEYVQTGKVRLVHRDLPLRQHPYARLAARYANAAGHFGAYDAVASRLFINQAGWIQNGDIEAQISQALSPAVFRQVQALVKDPGFDDTIDADIAMARQDRIDRTPSLVVVFRGKREVVPGLPSFAMLKSYLDELLAR